MGQVYDAGHAEYQGEADRQKRIDATTDQSKDDYLFEFNHGLMLRIP
jgi:hypothetical protein